MALRASSNTCTHRVWLLITWPPHCTVHMNILFYNMRVCVCVCVREREREKGKGKGKRQRESFPELNVEFLRTKIIAYYSCFSCCVPEYLLLYVFGTYFSSR